MTKNGTSICSRILTPKQVGSICWFMAAFVAMFYSQRSRKLLLNASSDWNTKKELFSLLKHILDDKYLKVASRESEDYEKFSDNTFGEVLSLLNKEDSKAFPYNPKTVSGGFNPEFYIGKLYKLLGVDYKLFDYNVYDNHLFYHFTNEELNSTEYKIEKRKVNIYLYDNKIFKYEDKYTSLENDYTNLINKINTSFKEKITDELNKLKNYNDLEHKYLEKIISQMQKNNIIVNNALLNNTLNVNQINDLLLKSTRFFLNSLASPLVKSIPAKYRYLGSFCIPFMFFK
jgi:hypothetical protein